jgi:long-chain acyl-CoA synthetase
MAVLIISEDSVGKVAGLKTDGKTSALSTVVVMGNAGEEELTPLRDAGLTAMTWIGLIEKGKASIQEFRKPAPDDVINLNYTSGTTGDPKGAMITHRGVCSQLAGLGPHCYFSNTSVHLALLPFQHIGEKILFHLCIFGGTAIGFSQGNPALLLSDA